jgi:hypothetical protein
MNSIALLDNDVILYQYKALFLEITQTILSIKVLIIL